VLHFCVATWPAHEPHPQMGPAHGGAFVRALVDACKGSLLPSCPFRYGAMVVYESVQSGPDGTATMYEPR
jgi:hypothetical protein